MRLEGQEVNWSKLHPDYVGLGAVILSLFVFLFNFTIVEVWVFLWAYAEQ